MSYPLNTALDTKRRFRTLRATAPYHGVAGCLAGLLVLGACMRAIGQGSVPTDTQPAPQDIRQNNPGFLVRADVNKGSRSYREGDTLYVQVAS